MGATKAFATDNTIIHTVQAGDTLSSIAKIYGTTYEAIMELNGLTNTLIYPGQQLKVSQSGGVEAPIPKAANIDYRMWKLSLPTGIQMPSSDLQAKKYNSWWYPGTGAFEGYISFAILS